MTINQVHKIKLTTLSPVSVGDGDSLIPFTDYLLDGDEVVYIDQEKMEARLSEKPEYVLDELVKNIGYAANVRKNDFLLNFIEDASLLDTSLEAVSRHGRIPAYGIDNVTELQTIVKNFGQPYIPGSTIKGAMKNAILFDWLREDPAGREALRQFKESLFSRSKDRRDNPNKVYQEKVEDKIFGSLRSRRRMPYSMFRVADTNPLPTTDALGVYKTDRFHLSKGNPDTQLSMIKEAVNAGCEFNFTLEIDAKTKTFDKYIKKFRNNIFELFDIINYFTLENLYQELDYFREEINPQVDKELSDYYSFLEDRVQEIEGHQKNKQSIALMRLGSGKTYYYNSIGLAFMQTYEKAEDRFRRQFRLRPKQDLFPVTRTITHDKRELGWVRIENVL